MEIVFLVLFIITLMICNFQILVYYHECVLLPRLNAVLDRVEGGKDISMGDSTSGIDPEPIEPRPLFAPKMVEPQEKTKAIAEEVELEKIYAKLRGTY